MTTVHVADPMIKTRVIFNILAATAWLPGAYAGPGAFDPTFGVQGVVAREERPILAVALDSRVIVAQGATRTSVEVYPGYTATFTRDISVSRLNDDGSTDATFNGGQTLLSPPCSGCSYLLNTLAVAPDGKILVGATLTEGHTRRAAILRLSPGGAVDASFGNGGVVYPGGSDMGLIAPRPDGRMLVTTSDPVPVWHMLGTTVYGPSTRLRRLNSDGSLHALFDPDTAAAAQFISKIHQLPSGEILAPGGDHDFGPGTAMAGQYRLKWRRYTAAGTVAEFKLVEPAIYVDAAAFDATGRLWVAGDVNTPQGMKPTISRYTAAGERDPAFSPGLLWLESRPASVLPLPGGGAVLTGTSVIRLLPDGTVDQEFANRGELSQRKVPAAAGILLPDGKVTLYGIDGTFTGSAIARLDLARTAFVALEYVAFGPQSLGTLSEARELLVNNTTASPITVTAAVSPPYEALNECQGTLIPGASCSVQLFYRPRPGDVTSTDREGQAIISGNDGTSATVFLGGSPDPTPVPHYYGSILRREPDVAGANYWKQLGASLSYWIQVQGNLNEAPKTPEAWYAMAMSFFGSAEYAALNRDVDEYLTDLYRTFFDRAPDVGGMAYWKGRLAQGLTRDGLLLQFMFSPEFMNFTAANYGETDIRSEITTVLDLYRGLLHRAPDVSGFNYYVDRFQSAQCSGTSALYAQVEQLSSFFANSPEYAALARDNALYVVDLYNAFLRRGPDVDGISFWRSRLDSGAMSREEVRRAFISSPEFGARVQQMLAEPCIQQ